MNPKTKATIILVLLGMILFIYGWEKESEPLCVLSIFIFSIGWFPITYAYLEGEYEKEDNKKG